LVDEEVVRRWFDEPVSAFRRPSGVRLEDPTNKMSYLVKMLRVSSKEQVIVGRMVDVDVVVDLDQVGPRRSSRLRHTS
jgi:hypothetical protein